MVVAITPSGHGSGAALAPASSRSRRAAGPTEWHRSASPATVKCLQLKALLPGWALPPAHRQSGPTCESGPPPEDDGLALLERVGRNSRLRTVKNRMLEPHADGGWITKSRLCRAEDSQLKLNRPTGIGCTVLLGEGLNFWCAQGKYLV